MVDNKKPTHYIYDVPKGSPKNKRIYFNSYAEAKDFIKTHRPGEKGTYHIYPVDNEGYTSKRDGRRSWHK